MPSPGPGITQPPTCPSTLPPPIHPGTRKPLEPADLSAIFPAELIAQEMSTERWIAIPDEVRDVYRLWRPTPLKRAARFEQALGTRCRIYFKDESTSPVGSHKVNTALAQAYYNKQAGIERLTTETGAGQWGTALSFACSVFGLRCRVFMVKVSYNQKPSRRTMMKIWGSEVFASPSTETEAGRAILDRDPDCPGSLGIAISEAVEEAAKDPSANYSLGSVLHHVLLHQTVIGLEASEQLGLAGEKPDYLVGCVGGGSNFGGLVLPFLPEKLRNPGLTIIGVEPTACPTMTRGRYAYDFGDTAVAHAADQDAHARPRLHPPGNPCRRPALSRLLAPGQRPGRARTRRSLAPSLRAASSKPRSCSPGRRASSPRRRPRTRSRPWPTWRRAEPGEKCIVFNLSGHGLLDLGSYEKYLAGELVDFEHPAAAIEQSLVALPTV